MPLPPSRLMERLYFKAVNPNDQSVAIELTVKDGFPLSAATMLQVAPGKLDARNSLDKPDAIRPLPAAVNVNGQQLRFVLPRWAAAVVTIKQ